jgi:hypothetical protein
VTTRIGGATAPPHETTRAIPAALRLVRGGEGRSGRPRRAPRAARATPAAGARVEEETQHGEVEELRRLAGR